MNREHREAAFTDFVSAKQRHLRHIAFAICGDWNQADDLLQTALTRLYVAWPRIDKAGNPEGYVRQIMVRANIDEHRRPWRREKPGLPTADIADSEGLPFEDRNELLEACLSLPPMQRKVVILRHWLGLSISETARELEISEGTVKSHAARGLAALEQYLLSGRLHPR